MPPTTLRAIAGGRVARPAAAATDAEALDGERWMNEGGSVGSEAAAGPPRAIAAGR